jgi:three-Cys-motif partner protein
LAFVDTCAGSGLFDSHNIGTVPSFGSPLIGIKALHALVTDEQNIGRDIQSKSLLVEKIEQTFKSLRAAVTQYAPNESNISLVYGEFADKIDDILRFCENYFSLVLIDPFGPSSVPFWAVSRIVAQKFNDVIMHFPSNAILWMSGHHSVDEPTSRISQERVKWLDDFFGSPDWRNIFDSTLSTEEKEERGIKFYLERLLSKDILAIGVPLRFETKERPLYHLVFMTRNLSGLMEMKRIMQEAKEYEAFRRDQLKQQLKIEKTGQTEMFDVEKAEPKSFVNIEELSQQLHRKFKSQSVTREAVYRDAIFLAHVLKTDIDKALTRLKQQGLIEPKTGKASLKQQLKFQ